MADDASQFAYHPANPAGDEPAQPVPNPTSYTIHKAGPETHVIHGRAKTAKTAMRVIDRLDRAHGASVHFKRPG